MSRMKNYDPSTSQWVHSDKAGLPANVFPTFDDLRVNNGSELQIKNQVTTIKKISDADVAIGTTVYINESKIGDNWKAYCLLEKNETYCKIVRKSSIGSMYMNNTSDTGKGYKDSIIDNYIVNTWLPTLSDDGLNSLVEATFATYSYNNGGNINLTRKAILLSRPELLQLLELTGVYAGWTRTNHDTNANTKFQYSNNNAGYQYSNKDVYPVLAINNNATLDDNNHLLAPVIHYETTQIDTIHNDTKYYKLKDLDARAAISDLTTTVAGKAAASHTHTVSDITDFPTIPTAGTITSGSTGYAVAGDVYTALSKSPYDLCFIAETDSYISPTTSGSGATISNASLAALSSLDDMLAKINHYDKLEVCGGFRFIDPNSTVLLFIQVTLSHCGAVPNQIAAQQIPLLVPSATINSKDAVTLKITPVYNINFSYDYIIWEDEDDVRQIALIPS